MEKELLEQFIQNGVSANKIAKETKKSLTTVRYWLKKYNLITNFVSFKDPNYIHAPLEEKKCPNCEITKSVDEFHHRKDGKGVSPYCKKCTILQTMMRQKAFKQRCVDYKGGKCIHCEYNNSLVALEFHHVDPSKKDFSISNVRSLTFNNVIKEELDKCILLCSNCHREEHERMHLITGKPTWTRTRNKKLEVS